MTYFELDSEEATHCDHCHLICCMYIKGHVKTVDTKDQSNAIVYWWWYLFVNTVDMMMKAHNALNAMFVEIVDTLVFVALRQHLIQSTMRFENSTLLCLKWPLAPARREGYLLQYSIWKTFHLGGLAVHQSVWGGRFVNFLGLVKLQGWL